MLINDGCWFGNFVLCNYFRIFAEKYVFLKISELWFHIRDLMVSHNKENKYFDSDLDLLERICTKHYLLFEDGQIEPVKPFDNQLLFKRNISKSV